MTKREDAVRAVIDVLKQGEFTTKEVALKAGIPYLRKAERILEFLQNVNLVEEKDGNWVWSERKTSFSTKHEYDIAMRHSKLLVLSSSDHQGLDQMNPWAAVRLIAFNYDQPDEPSEGYDPAPLLVEHLKSGYFKEFWLPMLEYRGLQDKHHFPIRGNSPLGGAYNLEDLEQNTSSTALAKTKASRVYYRDKDTPAPLKNVNTSEQLAKEILGEKPNVVPYPGGFPGVMHDNSSDWTPEERAYHIRAQAYYEEASAKHKQEIKELSKRISTVPKDDIDKAGELIDHLMGQLSGIVMRVRQGIPLTGGCSACPTRSVKITG